MRKLMACLVALVSIGTVQSNAAVIYSTLGPGNSYNTGIGWTISSSQYIAMPFTVTGGDYFFNSAEAALFGSGGGGNVILRLRANNAGLPGSILETIPLGGVTGVPNLLTANSTIQSVLQNGNTYWLEILPASGFLGGWNWANAGFTGPFAFSNNGGVTYFNTSGQLSAFRINGTLTPEPLSVLVFGGVLAAGGLAVRRRVRATA